MDSQKVMFVGSPDADWNYSLFFYENVAEQSKQNKEEDKALISYLREEAVGFFY